MSNKLNDLNIAGARLIFRNFAGKEDDFNRAGQRNFAVVLDDPEVITQLMNDGWNVKTWVPKNNDGNLSDGATPMYYLPVSVEYKNFPPLVYLVTGNKKKLLTEDLVNAVDYAEIINADVVISPYCWSVSGKSGVKAYLKTAYISIVVDAFGEKYERFEDIG